MVPQFVNANLVNIIIHFGLWLIYLYIYIYTNKVYKPTYNWGGAPSCKLFIQVSWGIMDYSHNIYTWDTVGVS